MYKKFKATDSGRVLVVGDIILDRYLYGDTARISPEAPVPVVRVTGDEERPGGAANVAINVKSLGVETQLVGITGTDEASESLSRKLVDKKVICNFVRLPDFSTITKVRVMSQNQQLLRLDYESASNLLATDELIDLYKDAINDCKVVVLSDYAKGSLNNTEKLIAMAKKKGKTILVDPKGENFNRYRGASLLTPNIKEFETIVGKCIDNQQIFDKAIELCKSLDISAILITRGADGMVLVDTAHDNAMHLQAISHEVFDVTGAGDTVIAAMSAALASGYSFEESMLYANCSAGIVVEKLGTASVSIEELNSVLGDLGGNKTHAVTLDEIKSLIAKHRSGGEKIVMTNGCFDIIHAGHVKYLKQARALGDVLIVAINDDDSVRRLKGDSRPVNTVSHRMEILRELSSVDYVFSFSEDTPEKVINQINPDILVKGGDYTVDEIAGSDQVISNGGTVEILPFQDGCSTTDLINKIIKK